MVGDHQHGRRVIGKREQPADFTVHFLVVITNRILKFVAGLVEAMSRIHIVPKRMVDTVHAHLNYHEIVPIFLRQQMPRELEALPGHLVNICQNLLLIAGSKIAHIQNILADHPLNLLFEFRRMRVLAGYVGS